MSFAQGTEEDTAESEPTYSRRGRKTGKFFIAGAVGLLIVALTAGAFIVNLARTYDDKTETIQTAFPEESTRPQKQVPVDGAAAINILVMGSDSRDAEKLDAVDSSATDQRADSLMIMHVPADRKNVYTISLMRDLWVPIPGHGEAKINAALAFGGVPLMVQTVESLFHQRIDHVAMVDFEGFRGLTDALGGVQVNVSVPFASSGMANQYFAEGPAILNGTQALAFVRERYAFADGDYQRVRNQQAFLKGLIAKVLDAKTLTNPVTISGLVGTISPFVRVDERLDAAAVAGLAMELRNLRQQNMVMFTLPTRGVGTSTDGQSIVLTDPDAVTRIAAAMGRDTLGEFVAATGLEKGN